MQTTVTAVQSGTYLYHSHDHIDRQQSLGLYGAMLIDPANPADEIKADKEYTIQLQEWLMREGLHCHIAHHTTNNNVETNGGGGLMMVIDVEGDPTR